MKPVSAATIAAYLAGTMQITPTVTISLLDNGNNVSVSASATSTLDGTLTPASRAIDGITATDRKWAAADAFNDIASGGRELPDIIYPVDSTRSIGWWGNTLGDSAGSLGGTETLTLTYVNPTAITQITWWGDTFLGYPKDFSVEVDFGNGTWVVGAVVTGWASPFWSVNASDIGLADRVGAQIQVKQIRLKITKMSLPYVYAKVLEFQGGLTVDVSTIVESLTISQERTPDNATTIVGTASAATLDLNLINNTQYDWSPGSASGLYSKYLRSNRKIIVALTIAATGEITQMGTFYSKSWDAVTIEGKIGVQTQDRFKKLREQSFINCPLYVSQSPEAIMASVLSGLGINNSVLATTGLTIPYAWCTPGTKYFKFLCDLAAVAGGFCYFDANDVFHFEDALYLANNRTTSVLTLTDDNAIIKPQDKWDEADVKNHITVTVNAVKLASSATIWSLQETLSIPAGGTITVTPQFQGPATAVGAPTVTASGGISILSWTAYAMTGTLVLINTAGTTGTVTAITIAGQLLSSDGTNPIQVQDDAGVQTDGPRDLALNNPYIQTLAAAKSTAYALLQLYRKAPSRLTIDCVGLPFLELGDRITVTSTIAGINADYWVIRHTINWDGALRSSMDCYLCTPGTYPARVTLWRDEATVIAGAASAITISGTNRYDGYVSQGTGANGDSFTHSFWLAAGLYSFSVLYNADTTMGVVTWSVDGTAIGTTNTYAAAPAVSQVATIFSVTVTEGYHTLRGVISAGAGAGYMARLTKYWFTPINETKGNS